MRLLQILLFMYFTMISSSTKPIGPSDSSFWESDISPISMVQRSSPVSPVPLSGKQQHLKTASPDSENNNLDKFNQKIMLIGFSFFLTTCHVQDFKDVLGDTAVGRKTIPMVYPTTGRVVYAFFIIFWAILFSKMWELEVFYAAALIALSVLMAIFALSFKTAKSDLLTNQLYCVSKLPAYRQCEYSLIHSISFRHILCLSSSFRPTIALEIWAVLGYDSIATEVYLSVLWILIRVYAVTSSFLLRGRISENVYVLHLSLLLMIWV